MSESTNAQPHHDTPRKPYPNSSTGLIRKPDQEKLRADLRAVMQNKITIITPEKFLEVFVPEAEAERDGKTKDIFKSLDDDDFKTERRMYAPIIKALNDAELCPGFAFASTPFKGDKKAGTKEAVDGGLYPVGGIPRPTKSSGTGARSCAVNWTTIEMCIECKADSVSGDPFDESQPNKAPEAKERQGVLGQILAYAQLVYDNQQRTHQFMLLFLGTSARIVYIDRSGIFATQKFDYKADATYVVEFIWRFARIRDQTKWGHDTTAERIPHHSTLGKKMKEIADKVDVNSKDPKDYAHVQFAKSLASSAVWWCLTVQDEFAAEGPEKERKFLVGQPHFSAPGVSGRGTRGYVALDYDGLHAPAPKFVYLKDAWRVVHEDIDKEGDTLRTLNGANVLYVPTVLHHGDLGQFTRSPELWVTYHRDVAPGTRCPLKKHSHYRLVVKEVGRPLEDFYNGEQLVALVLHCVKAHSYAYAQGIIHRDISVGNMLIYTDEDGFESGMLNDWELSKRLDDHNPEGRQLDRTGTWEYLSVFALDDPRKKIVIQDDLESFFHALLYMAVCFLPHNCKNVGAFLHHYFEDYRENEKGEYRCGSAKKRAIKNGYVDLDDQGGGRLQFLLPGSLTPHPINNLFGDLLSWFSAYFHLNEKVPEPLPESIPLQPSRPRPRMVKERKHKSDRSLRNFSRKDDLVTPEQEEKMRNRARDLDTHASFIMRLEAVDDEGKERGKDKERDEDEDEINVKDDEEDKGPAWPRLDKCRDKRPEGGYKRKVRASQPLSGTTRTLSGTNLGALSGTSSEAVHVPSSLMKEDTDDSEPEIPLSVTTGINKRPSSNVDGLEPPSTPRKRVQREQV